MLECWGLRGADPNGGVVRNYGIMYAMRPLRNFKTNQCCHLISRIANRAFFLTDEEKTRFVERLWRVAKSSGIEVAGGEKNRYLPGKQYRILRKGKAVVCA